MSKDLNSNFFSRLCCVQLLQTHNPPQTNYFLSCLICATSNNEPRRRGPAVHNEAVVRVPRQRRQERGEHRHAARDGDAQGDGRRRRGAPRRRAVRAQCALARFSDLCLRADQVRLLRCAPAAIYMKSRFFAFYCAHASAADVRAQLPTYVLPHQCG